MAKYEARLVCAGKECQRSCNDGLDVEFDLRLEEVARLQVLFDGAHDHGARALCQPDALGVDGGDSPVAGQPEAEDLGEAVHAVGGEHARAGTAAWTG